MPAPVAAAVAGVSVVFVPPLEFVAAQGAAFRLELEHLERLWARFKPLTSDVEEEQFDSEGHGAWPGLADSTIEQKSRYGYPADPLVRTGDLKDSLVNAGRAVEEESGETMVWGTGVDYAHWHQTGGYVAGRPPQRKLIDITPDVRQRYEREVINYVNEAAAITWGRV